jgi:hypothetical protein
MEKILFKYSLRIMIAITGLTVTSCEDFLTTPPVDRLTSDGFYQTPAQSEQGIVGIYADLRDIARDEFMYLSEFRSDNIWGDPQPDGFREYSELSAFRAGPDLSYINNVWNLWYKLIYNANVALVKIQECDFGTREDFKKQLLGEAYFLRGWAYFELARLYGNIPIIDAPTAPSDVMDVPQSTAADVYSRMVIPDLKNAQTMLPFAAEMKNASNAGISGAGRADKIAASAMLGRVYMTMAGFPLNDASAKTNAKSELKAVLDFSSANSDKYWAPDSLEWQKQWMSENNNKYSIFAIQYRSGGTGNSAIFETGAKLPPSYTSFQVYNELGVFVVKSIVYEFEKVYSGNKTDARGLGHSILLGYDAEPNWTARVPQLEALEPGSTVMVARNAMFTKYLNTKPKRAALGYTADIETAMKDYRDWPVNHPIIRLEDVMLMYAEILADEGNTSGAMEIVNKIRTRVGCDALTVTDAGVAWQAVKDERRIELFGEGVRWFDLVRWNEWIQAITYEFHQYSNPNGASVENIKNGRYLYPVPMNQINVKPGWYKQNEGY